MIKDPYIDMELTHNTKLRLHDMFRIGLAVSRVA